MPKNTHGGRRPGAGGKFKYGEPTKVIRVPVSRVTEVQRFLQAGSREPPKLAAVREVVSRWRRELNARPSWIPDPTWSQAALLLAELEATLKG